jgi:DNA-binding MarR family transcriptional regulator
MNSTSVLAAILSGLTTTTCGGRVIRATAIQVVENSIYSRLNKKEQAQFIKLLNKLHNVGKTTD